MPRPALALIDSRGVVLVNIPERFPHAVIFQRNRNKVDMVGHQAVGEDFDSVPAAELGQQADVSVIIGFLEVGPLAAISPLGDVMRDSGNDDSGIV